MSTSTDRSRVLRAGSAAAAVLPARLDAPLASSPFTAGGLAVDPRLTAPHLQEVLAEAVATATRRATADGFAAGHAQGLAVAAEQARDEQARTAQLRREQDAHREQEQAAGLASLQRVADAFRATEATAVADIEDVVIDLALRLARAVLDHELSVCAAPGALALARALRLAPDGAEVVARLHPDDLASTPAPLDPRVLLVADPDVERGGCVVEGAGRRIDAQLGTALARAAAVLT